MNDLFDSPKRTNGVSMSAAAIFQKLGENVAKNPEKATSVDGVFGFNITGDGGGEWTLNLKSGTTSDFVSDGIADNADVTITISASDWEGITAGTVNPMQAFMMGKIKVAGNMGLAMKLQNVLSFAS